jgi:predicted nuclease of predicted toxin-antitoxin system
LKLLLDQNLSRKLVAGLQHDYPGSSHVFLLGLHKATDSDIWYYARHHGYCLATKNKDMVDLCVFRGAPPKVIWFRVGNCDTQQAREVLDVNRARIAQFAADSARVVLSLFRLAVID